MEKEKRGNGSLILYMGIALAMVGYGVAMPLLPFYIENMGGAGIHMGLLIAAYGIMQFLFAPFWGGLSDTYGRKPILLVGMAGLGAGMALMGLADRLWMLYAGQAISGALSCAIYPAAMAYISDSYPENERSAAMGRIGSAAGLGIIIGPGIGGLLAFRSLSTPFFTAASFCVLTFALMKFRLKESLDSENRPDKGKKGSLLPSFRNIRQGLSSPMALGLIACFAIYFGKSGFSGVYGLFALEKFGYGPGEVGLVLGIMGGIYALAQGLLVGPMTRKWGETTVIRAAFSLIAIAFVLMAAASNTFTLLLSIGLFTLSTGVAKPAALSRISRSAENGRGAAMGTADSFMSLGRIMGPIFAGMVFDINIHLPYLGGGLFFGIMFLLTMRLKSGRKTESRPESNRPRKQTEESRATHPPPEMTKAH